MKKIFLFLIFLANQSFSQSNSEFEILIENGIKEYNLKNYENAYKYFSEASSIRTNDINAAMYSVIVSSITGNSEGVYKFGERYINNGGTDAAIYYTIAEEFQKNGNTEKAVSTINIGIEHNPTDTDLKNELINILMKSENTQYAITVLESIIQNSPNDYLNFTNLGTLYQNVNNFDKAIFCYKKAIEINPNHYDAQYNIGVLLFNSAVEKKEILDGMDFKTYQKDGAELEKNILAIFNQSLIYFENCYSINSSDCELVNILNTIYSLNESNVQKNCIQK